MYSRRPFLSPENATRECEKDEYGRAASQSCKQYQNVSEAERRFHQKGRHCNRLQRGPPEDPPSEVDDTEVEDAELDLEFDANHAWNPSERVTGGSRRIGGVETYLLCPTDVTGIVDVLAQYSCDQEGHRRTEAVGSHRSVVGAQGRFTVPAGSRRRHCHVPPSSVRATNPART